MLFRSELHRGDAITCTFTNSGVGTTRTQGFWQTHWSLLQAVWNDSGSTVGGIDYHGMSGRRNIGTCTGQLTVAQAAGGFWASIPWTTDRKNRGPISKAKMTLLQQLLAAKLNHELFGSSPAGSISIDQAEAAFCGTDATAIKAAAAAMGAFNQAGDTGAFTPGASANPTEVKLHADIRYWDSVKD